MTSVLAALIVLPIADGQEDLFPFVVPTLDASETVVDVSWLNDSPDDVLPITIQGGRFVDARGRRVRFLGTNLTFGACFPDKATSERIAARMAKLGINCVRFHHMDNRTAPGGIWLPDQAGLDPEHETLWYEVASR